MHLRPQLWREGEAAHKAMIGPKHEDHGDTSNFHLKALKSLV